MIYKNLLSKRTEPFRKIYEDPRFKLALKDRDNPINFPLLVDVELTNHCNFSCAFCGQQGMTRKRGFLSEELFRKLVNECKEKNAAMRFIRWGEPFLHPQIFDFIKLAKDNGVLLHITTNGSLLDKEKNKSLVALKLDSIIFSFQGATKEEYEKMRDDRFYEKLKENILNFVAIRGEKEKPYLHISCTVTNEPKRDIKEFIKYWSNIVDSVGMGKTNFSRLSPLQIKKVEMIDKLEELKKQETIKKEYRPCREVYQKLSVNFDGKVSACCGDFDDFLIVGDLNKDNLENIWKNSRGLKAIRALLDNGRFRSLSLCSTCYHTYEDF